MKRWIGAVIGIVALLVGMAGGYLLAPDVALWMAEMEAGKDLVARWQESCVAMSRMQHDQRVLAEMETNPAYALLEVEDEYPFARIVNVTEGEIMEVWMYLDLTSLSTLYSDKDERNQARLDATAATIRLAIKAFPDVSKIKVYWASFPMAVRCVEGECYILSFDILIGGGQSLFEWAENPDLDALIALAEAGEVTIMQGGYWAQKYCEGSLLRLSSDPHPWEEVE